MNGPYCSPRFSAVKVGTFAVVGLSPDVLTTCAMRMVGRSMPITAPPKNTTHRSIISSRYQRRHRRPFSGVSGNVTPTGRTSCCSPRMPDRNPTFEPMP
jgi:hypothetical protein